MNRLQYRIALAVTFGLTAGLTLAGTPDFAFQSTELAGYVMQPGLGSGVAAADFDRDGDIDLFLPTAEGSPNLLFVNQGDATFIESAASVGLADPRAGRTAIWYDYEGDDDLDLAIARDCWQVQCDFQTPIVSLYQNDNGTFTEVTTAVGLFRATAGLDPSRNHVGGMSAGEMNGDGLPDLYIPVWQGQALLFFSGDFTTVRGDLEGGYLFAGPATGIADQDAGTWQGLFHDFNRDGLQDLFVNVDFTANQLWMHGGGFNFTNTAITSGVDTIWNEMGLAPGDYDADGDIDIYITNIFGWLDQPRINRLYRNDTVGPTPVFQDVATAMGVDDTAWGWGTTWLDADNDGDLDLAATNGYCQPEYCGAIHQFDQSRFFLNPGDGSPFVDVSNAVGLNDTNIGSSLVTADFNNDGRQDLFMTALDGMNNSIARLLINTGNGGDYLSIVTDQVINAGTLLTLNDGNNQHAKLLTTGTSFMGQEPAIAHFGLNPPQARYDLIVTWPDGARSVWAGKPLSGTATEPFVATRQQLFSHGFEAPGNP